jgi:two-component system LytT family response regulator
MTDGRVRVLIADDERPAREKIRRFLAGQPDVEVVFEAGDGARALDVIRNERPDIVFLDIRMPGVDGLAVAEALPTTDGPVVVFATAFDEHALRAFDLHAADYLLKPFDRERFAQALERARMRLRQEQHQDDLEHLRQILRRLHRNTGGDTVERLVVEAENRSRLLPVSHVIRFEAARNYLEVVTGDATYRIRGTITDLDQILDPKRFARINRSQIVNLDCVEELESAGHGDIDMRLRGGDVLRLTRRYRDRVARWRV